MKNGWIEMRLATHSGVTGHTGADSKALRVLLWIVGHGVDFGRIYETPDGLLAVPEHHRGSHKINAWQYIPNGPNTRSRTRRVSHHEGRA